MFVATAGTATSIRIRMPDYTYVLTPTPHVIDEYLRLLEPPLRHLSDFKPEQVIYVPNPIKPQWFTNVLRRVRASVKPNYRSEMHSGQWLSQEVADAASTFFQKTADLLPGEPFIYSSRLGDLVAEFKGEHGTMTSIVSPTFALLFAVIGGVSFERRVLDGGDVREAVRELSEMLRMGEHGALDTAR